MRRIIPFLILTITVGVAAVRAQETRDQNTPLPTPSAAPMGEDDHLPFMRDQSDGRAPVDEPTTGGLALKMIAALLLIVGLIFAGAWAARKFAPGLIGAPETPNDTSLAVINTIQLGPGRSIATIRFGERVLLVGSTAQAFTLLAEEELSAPVSVRRSVAEMLDENAFANEIDRAESRLDVNDGGRAS